MLDIAIDLARQAGELLRLGHQNGAGLIRSKSSAVDLVTQFDLASEQLAYAASDVLHLHALWDRLEGLLRREGRLQLAEACFRFLPTRGELDLLGYEEPDIFAH